MVNWKKWFLEEDEDEIYKAEEGRRDKQEKPTASNKESDFDIEEFEEESIVDKKEARKYEEIDLDEYSVPEDFDIEFTEEDEEDLPPQKYKREKNDGGLMGRIKGLFSSSNNKQFSDDDFEDDFEEDDEAEDYKTYLERQRREEKLEKEGNYTLSEDLEDDEEYEEEYEEKPQGFFNRLKERLFSVSEEDIEKEELDAILDDLEDEQTSDNFVEEIDEKFERTEQQDYSERVHIDKINDVEFEEIDLSEYEEGLEKEEKPENTTSLTDALKELGVENSEIKDVDIFGDKSDRRTHPTLAAVRTKRLKQDYKMDTLGTEVALEKDHSDLKNEIAKAYESKESFAEQDSEARETKNKDARVELNENFNKLERREDKIQKDNVLYKQDKELDELFEEIKVKEEESHLRAVPELEVRTVDAEGERREKVKYTTVDDILEGNDDLFEDDIDRTSKKIVGERFDETIKATKEVEDFRKDLYEGRRAETVEKTALDELIEAENIDIFKKEETLPEIEKLNINLKEFKEEHNIEDIEEDIDLVEKAARIEDIEVEDYDEIKEHKKDILEGYSDYHLDENEIIELEEQNHLDETATDVDIDRLLADISPRNKVKTMNNDVDKFVDEKVEPIEVAAQRVEKHLEEDEVVEEQEEEEIGIDYTEKLYTDDVFDYFDKGNGRKLGEYKTIDHGYRPVSKEKIENNQRILDAIFEKYSNNNISSNKSVTSTMMTTNTITPKMRSVGKFKPTPVYSSVYGSGLRKDVEVKPTAKPVEETSLKAKKGGPVKKTTEPKNKKKSEVKVGKNEQVSADIYKEIASQEETVWNIGSAKRVPKSKIKTKKDKK